MSGSVLSNYVKNPGPLLNVIRVLALVPYPPGHAPSQRYRLEQWVPYLDDANIKVTVVPFQNEILYRLLQRPGHPFGKAANFAKAFARRLGIRSQLDACDAVVLHREAASLGPALVERWVARRKPLVFDFDDAIWMRSANPVHPIASWLKASRKTRTIARLAVAVLAGNAYLAEWARQYNSNVHLVPTTIDTKGLYAQAKKHQNRAKPVVGWTGSPSTAQYLETIHSDLVALRRSTPFKMRIIGARVEWTDLEVEHIEWNAATEARDLLDIDVGLMPQPDSPWTRGKCGAKALQYMGLGIPAIVSANGVLPEIVEHQKDGLLVSEGENWAEPIKRLLADPSYRQRLGEHARRTVEERFSAHVHAARVADILRSAV